MRDSLGSHYLKYLDVDFPPVYRCSYQKKKNHPYFISVDLCVWENGLYLFWKTTTTTTTIREKYIVF